MAPDEQAGSRSYLRMWLLPLLAIQLLATLLCVYVDPRNVFQHGLSPSLDHLRLNETRTSKLETALRGGYDPVVFGSSRVHMGVDTDSAAFQGKPVLNLGLPASTLPETIDVLELVLARGAMPKQVLMFTQLDQMADEPAPSHLTARSPLDARQSPFTYYLEHLVSFASLKDALAVLDRLRERPNFYTTRLGTAGFLRPPGPSRPPFEDKLGREWSQLENRRFDAKLLARLRAVLVRLCEGGHDIRIALSPVHALHLSLWLDGADSRAEYARMLGFFADLPDREATACVRVWDFSGFSGVRAEPLPAAGSRARMRHYVESSHFYPPVGDAMLARMLGVRVESDVELSAVVLTRATLSGDLSRLDRERAEYAKAFAEDVAWMRGLRDAHKPTVVAGRP